MLSHGPVRAMLVVVSEVLDEHLLEVTATGDEESVQALSAHRADEPLGKGVGPRCSNRGLDDSHALRAEDLVEAGGELGV